MPLGCVDVKLSSSEGHLKVLQLEVGIGPRLPVVSRRYLQEGGCSWELSCAVMFSVVQFTCTAVGKGGENGIGIESEGLKKKDGKSFSW